MDLKGYNKIKAALEPEYDKLGAGIWPGPNDNEDIRYLSISTHGHRYTTIHQIFNALEHAGLMHHTGTIEEFRESGPKLAYMGHVAGNLVEEKMLLFEDVTVQ